MTKWTESFIHGWINILRKFKDTWTNKKESKLKTLSYSTVCHNKSSNLTPQTQSLEGLRQTKKEEIRANNNSSSASNSSNNSKSQNYISNNKTSSMRSLIKSSERILIPSKRKIILLSTGRKKRQILKHIKMEMRCHSLVMALMEAKDIRT